MLNAEFSTAARGRTRLGLRLAFALLASAALSGCAFYEKNFTSEIVLEGTNHRGEIYADGAFYINADPAIRMRMGCFENTQLGATMSPLIPFPILDEADPHESIAGRQATLRLSHRHRIELDLSDVPITLDLQGSSHPLRLISVETPEYTYQVRYTYAADLECRDLVDGVLTIRLGADTVRRYGVRFQEEVQREFAWHPYFVT